MREKEAWKKKTEGENTVLLGHLHPDFLFGLSTRFKPNQAQLCVASASSLSSPPYFEVFYSLYLFSSLQIIPKQPKLKKCKLAHAHWGTIRLRCSLRKCRHTAGSEKKKCNLISLRQHNLSLNMGEKKREWKDLIKEARYCSSAAMCSSLHGHTVSCSMCKAE